LVTAQVGGRRYGKQQEGLLFFKKKQKTPAQLASAFPQRLSLNLSKFFGSFFQKRTAFLAACPSVEAISIPGQLLLFSKKLTFLPFAFSWR
jgi:hypothetical protein